MRLGIFFAIIATTFAGEVYEDFNPSDAILTPPIAEGFNLTDDLLIVNKRQFVPVAPSILRPVLSEWPLKTFSPYLDIISWPVLNAAQIAKSQGIFNFKLAFIVADANNAPSWGGTVPISHYAQQIREIRALRGNVAVSFGGSAGRELGVVYPTFCQLADVYSQVIDAHNFTWVDFLLEGSSLTNTASIDVRNQALVSLKAKYPRLRISYTLPAQLNGLSAAALNVLQSSVKFKLNVDIVNVLAMNYGAAGVAGNMGNAAIQTAISVHNQVRTLKMNSGIGITPMIGVNNVGSQVFSQYDASLVASFAQRTSWIREVSFWSLNRDTAKFGALYTSSQITQKDFEFSSIFRKVEARSGVAVFTSLPVPPRPVSTMAPASTARPAPSPVPVTPVSPGGWPSRVFAPYVNHWNNPANIMQKAAIGAGTKFFTLAFILADDKGQPAWNAWQLVTDGFLKTEIANLRARGGNVIFSLGGAGGKELAVVTGDVNALQQKYQVILNAYPGVSWLDFDIEGPHLDDTGANDRRNKALAALQRANPNIIIAYTLPTTPSGLLGNALSLLRSAKNNGLRVDLVNIMTMSMGVRNGATDMGSGTITAAQGLRRQLLELGLPNTKIGLTPMIGQNDIPSEFFRIEDARQVLTFSKENSYIQLLSFWSLQRDNNIKTSNLDSSSNYAQEDLGFSKAFGEFEK